MDRWKAIRVYLDDMSRERLTYSAFKYRTSVHRNSENRVRLSVILDLHSSRGSACPSVVLSFSDSLSRSSKCHHSPLLALDPVHDLLKNGRSQAKWTPMK